MNKKKFKTISNNEFVNINIDNENHNLPSFIFNRNYTAVKDKNIYFALNFVSNYMQKKILKPNNLLYPKFRTDLQNLFK